MNNVSDNLSNSLTQDNEIILYKPDETLAMYAPISVKTYTKAHDRFLIIDDTVYHIGASLKDLGKLSHSAFVA